MSLDTPISRALEGFAVPDWADPFVTPDDTALGLSTSLTLATERSMPEAREGIDAALTEAGFTVTWVDDRAEAEADRSLVTVRILDRRQSVPMDKDGAAPPGEPGGDDHGGWLHRNMRRKVNARLAKVARDAGPPPEMDRTLVTLSVSEVREAAADSPVT